MDVVPRDPNVEGTPTMASSRRSSRSLIFNIASTSRQVALRERERERERARHSNQQHFVLLNRQSIKQVQASPFIAQGETVTS